MNFSSASESEPEPDHRVERGAVVIGSDADHGAPVDGDLDPGTLLRIEPGSSRPSSREISEQVMAEDGQGSQVVRNARPGSLEPHLAVIAHVSNHRQHRSRDFQVRFQGNTRQPIGPRRVRGLTGCS